MEVSEKLHKKGIPASMIAGKTEQKASSAKYSVLEGIHRLFARLGEEGKMDRGKSCWLLDWALFYSHLSDELKNSAELMNKVVANEKKVNAAAAKRGSAPPQSKSRSKWMRLVVSRQLIEAWNKTLETTERYHRACRPLPLPSDGTTKGNVDGQKERGDGAGTAMDGTFLFVTSEMAHLAVTADCVMDDWLMGIY